MRFHHTLFALIFLAAFWRSSHCQRQSQTSRSVTPDHHSFPLTSPSSSSLLWRFTLAAADCPPGISLHAVVTLPTDAPEGKTVTLTSSTGNCPASMVLCASTWRDATTGATVQVDVVGERGVRYDVSFSPIADRELTLLNGEATVNGTIRRAIADERVRGGSSSTPDVSEMYFLRLSNFSNFSDVGQMEISIESFDVPKSALGRKKDRRTNEPVPRFVASLLVSEDCHACRRRLALEGDIAASAGPSYNLTHLSFTTFGKITLSRRSIPDLRDGVWFIAVKPSPDSDHGAPISKDFRLSVKLTSPVAKSRYVAPLVIVSLIVGVIFIFIDVFLLYVRYTEFRKDAARSKAVSTFRLIFRNLYLYVYNCVCWFKRGVKTFPYLVLIFGVTLFIPGLQTIAGTLVQRWETGDLDLCYYNEKCYVAGRDFDYPENSVVSNVAYVVHGILFVLLYSFVETSCRARGHFDVKGGAVSPCRSCRAKPGSDEEKCDYSLAYALGWTLIFQGLFSGIYHLCPTRRAVQFDQSFMFVLAILIVVAVLRGSLKIVDFRASLSSSSSASSPISSPSSPLPRKAAKEMRSPKIFLFFLCPLVVFNYVGTLQNMKEIPVYGTVITSSGKFAFGFFLFLWIILVLGWAAYKMRFKERIVEMFFPKGLCWRSEETSDRPATGGPPPTLRDKLLLLLCLSGFLLYCLFILYYIWSAFRQDDDMAKTFVATTLISALLSVAAAEILAAHFVWQRRRLIFWRYVSSIVSFYVLVMIAWSFAFWFFKKENPSKKEIEPWISRERNKDCFVGGYFDGHDVWHICSSFGIFLTCIRVVHLSNPCPRCFQERFVEEPLKRVAIAANAVAKWKRRVSTLRRRGDDVAGDSAEGIVAVNGRRGEAEERRAMTSDEDKSAGDERDEVEEEKNDSIV